MCACELVFVMYPFRVSIEHASPACRNERRFHARYSGGRQRQGEPRFETTRATVFQLQFAAHGER